MKAAPSITVFVVIGVALAGGTGAACSSPGPRGGDAGDGSATGGAPGSVVDLGGRDLVATILQSASTNSRSIRVDVYADASAERTIGPPTQIELSVDAGASSLDGSSRSFPAGSPDVIGFLQALADAGDLSTLPIWRCSKSISFGTTTNIMVDGELSGDLQCIDTSSDASAGRISEGKALYAASARLVNSG